jgi:hypothetical protein
MTVKLYLTIKMFSFIKEKTYWIHDYSIQRFKQQAYKNSTIKKAPFTGAF